MNRWKTVRIIIGAVGLAMVATALVSALPETPGRIEFLLLILGVAVIAAAILGPRAGAAYRSAAIIGLNTVLLFVVLEVSVGVLLRLASRGQSAPDDNPPAASADPQRSPFYAHQEWASRYWAEFQEVRMHPWYQPHEMLRRRPHAGQLTNISADGLRVTPGAACESGAVLVYAFGGSTLWGYGVPDWGTIPAYLQAHWSRTMARPVCVVNFGQLGHSSTQGVIALERQLQRCEIPDLVISYDGVNDLSHGRDWGIPGAHEYLLQTAQRLDGGLPVAPSGVQSLTILRLIRELIPPEPPPPHRYRPHPDDVAPELGAGITEVYLNNLRMVGALAREYGFAHIFFWQPHIWMGKKPLTEAEKHIQGEGDDIGASTGRTGQRLARRLYRQVYASIARAARSDDHLHDISDVFDSVPSLLYLDSHHLTPDGNRLVADRMRQVIGDRIAIPVGARPARACRTTAADH